MVQGEQDPRKGVIGGSLEGLLSAKPNWGAIGLPDIVRHTRYSRVHQVAAFPIPARAALAKRGIDISSYRSREIDVAMVEAADLVLTAVGVHNQGVLEVCPAAEGKVFTLMEFSGEELYYLFDDCHNLAPELRKPDFGDEPAVTEALIVEAEGCLAKVMPKILDFRR